MLSGYLHIWILSHCVSPAHVFKTFKSTWKIAAFFCKVSGYMPANLTRKTVFPGLFCKIAEE